ncbi:MAG: GNAT family N-acetyltransferase [Filifactoraceae bacterium]
METRFAQKEEKLRVKELWRYSFSDSGENVEYYFDKRYDDANSYVVTEGDDFIGSLQLNPYKLKVGVDVEDTSYIVGVSVEPEFRGRGYSSVLMKSAINELYRRGENISLLMPIDTNIYLRYGYINTFSRHIYTMNLRDVRYDKSNCTIERIKTITDSYYEELVELYNRASSSKRAAIYRNKEYFLNKLDELHVDNGELYIIREAGKAIGYFMFIAKYSSSKSLILEAVFNNNAALNSMFRFISSHVTQTTAIDMNFVDHKAFEIASKFSNRYDITKKHFMMSRVINAKYILGKVFETALESRILSDSEWNMFEGKVIVRVHDDFIEDNNKLFAVEYDGSFVEVYEVSDGKPKLELGIPELTQLYMRSAKLSNMQKYEDLIINDKDLESIFSIYEITKSSYINDFI